MSHYLGEARHSTHVVRSAQALPADGGGGTRGDYDPQDDTHNTGDGESRSYATWFDSTRDRHGAVAARADCATLAKASVSGGRLIANWSAYQICLVNQPGHSATAHEEGFVRCDRRFFADTNGALVSGTCSLDTTKFSFADLPHIDDFNITLRAAAGSGWESYIEADYVRNVGVWIVKYQYVYTVGTTSFLESGVYNRQGLDGLSSSEDRVYWSHMLPTVGRELKAEALINKTTWAGGYKSLSDQHTHQFLVGRKTRGLGCQAVVDVDDTYVQRTFPIADFPPS